MKYMVLTQAHVRTATHSFELAEREDVEPPQAIARAAKHVSTHHLEILVGVEMSVMNDKA